MEAIPYLIQLLKLSYSKKIIEDEFNSLHQNVLGGLTEIVLQPEKNYYNVKGAVQNLIRKHYSNLENLIFFTSS